MSIRGKLSKLTDEQLRQVRRALEEKTGKQSLQQQLNTLQNQSSSDAGVISADWELGKSEARTDLDNALISEVDAKVRLHRTKSVVMEAIHDVKETPIKLERKTEADKLIHEEVIITHQNALQTYEQANANGLSVENEKKRQETLIEVEKKKQIDAIEIQTELVRSDIKVNEHRDMKQIELDIHREETAIDVQAAIVSRVPEQFEVELLTQRLFIAIDKRELLLLDPDTEGRRKKLKQLDRNIRSLQKAIDGRAQGLIQGNKRPELRGLEES